MATYIQGVETAAKQDTVFACVDRDPAIDVSQYLTDLTANSAGGYELTSARTYLTYPRTLYCRFTVSASKQYAIAHSGGGEAFAIYTDGGSSWLKFSQDGASLYTYQGLPMGTGADISVQWATRANPDSSGVGDALISEVVAYNHSGLVGEPQSFTHAAPATGSASDTFAVGGRYSGGSLVDPVTLVTAARVDRRFHTTVEFHEDWISSRSGSASGSIDPLWPALDPSDTHAAPGAFVGQAQVGESAATGGRCIRRLISPLWNHLFATAPQWSAANPPAALVFGDPLYRSDLAWLRWATVPPGFSAARVRVNVYSTITAGDPVPLGVRVYSAADVPGATMEPPAFVGETLEADHGIAPGEWLDLGILPLRVFAGEDPKRAGTTVLALATAIDPDGTSGNDANLRYKINAINVWPVAGALGVIDD